MNAPQTVTSQKIKAAFTGTDEEGKRREQERPANHRKHARELIKQIRDELSKHGQAALDTHKMKFADLAAQYESKNSSRPNT